VAVQINHLNDGISSATWPPIDALSI
jgi:hypothetical protein